MNTKIIFTLLFTLLFFVVAKNISSQDRTIALAIKIIRDVDHKNSKIDWSKTKKGDVLYSGDDLRTGEKSIAIVKFKDNSMLRVREQSELKVIGEMKDGAFAKTVNVTRGEFTFDIQKQQENEKFIFSSPTSVAAIRGTEGTFSAGNTGDSLTVLDGSITFVNSVSNTSVNVDSGQTGISNPNGIITVHNSTPEEHNSAKNQLNAAQGTGQEKQLDIELKDRDNNKKKVRIKYHD